MNKKLLLLIFGILLIGIASASLGTFKQGSCVQIKTILNSSQVNISSLSYPNSTITLTNAPMTKVGSTFNLTFCNTSDLGTYTYDYYDELGRTYVNDFKITPSGSEDIGSGQGLSFIGSLIVMLIIASIFLFVGLGMKNIAGKISFISFSVIIFIMTILFIVVSAQQNLYGYPGLVTGAETFWFVIKILIGIGILALFIIVGLVIKKAWKIKRGYIDE